jgi:arylformamidase
MDQRQTSPEGDTAPRPVWRGLTAGQVRSQFDNRLAVPDGPAFVESYIRRSDAARARLPGARDLRYGPGPRQLIDVFPAPAPGAPVVMFWHGGAWSYQSKEHFSFVAEPLVAAGVTAVLVGYDLSPDVTLRRMIEEACEAVAWTCRHIASHGADPGRIVVSGHSAGAQLAGMALAHDFRAEGLPRAPVRGALLISGSYDMEPHRHHERFRALALDEDLVRDASPACNPPLDPDIPLILAAGANETPGYVWQAEAFAQKCRGRGHDARVLLSEGDHHFSVVERLHDPDHALTRALVDLAGPGAVGML